MSLSWTASAGATGYKILRATTSGGTFTQVGNSASTTYTDGWGLSTSTTYYYKVSAVNATSDGSLSSEQSAATTAVPGTCRFYPTTYTQTINSITYTCSLATATQFRCANASGTETITYTFPSVQAMIDSGASYNRNRETSGAIVGTGAANWTFTYNGSNQATAQAFTQGGNTYNFTYTAWDGSNRPTAGTMNPPAAFLRTGVTVSIVYNDATYTKTTTLSGGAGSGCATYLATHGVTPTTQVQDVNKIFTAVLFKSYSVGAMALACY